MSDKNAWRWPGEGVRELAGTAGPLSFVGGAGDFDSSGRIRNPGDLTAQIRGALANLAAALASEGCSLADIMRLKLFYTPDGGAAPDDWSVIAEVSQVLELDPLPAISTLSVPFQPFADQRVQVQAIAQRGWRALDDIRLVTRPIPSSKRALFDRQEVTAGLRAGEMIALANRNAAVGDDEIETVGDGVAQSHAIMAAHEEALAALGASFQDAIKMEGYYFGTTRAQWAGMAKARASHFREPGPVATVVPCHLLAPEGVETKVEVLAMRQHWNGYDKYIPRLDHWPRRVWDWPTPLPYRQAIGLRDMVWLGGQVPTQPDSNSDIRIFVGDLNSQTRFVMSLIRDLLRGFGRTPADLKLLVCYFRSDGSEEATRAFLETLQGCIGGPLPPATIVPQPHLHDDRITVEIWGVAQM